MSTVTHLVGGSSETQLASSSQSLAAPLTNLIGCEPSDPVVTCSTRQPGQQHASGISDSSAIEIFEVGLFHRGNRHSQQRSTACHRHSLYNLEDPRCFKVYFQTKALMEEVRRTGDASPLFYEGRR